MAVYLIVEIKEVKDKDRYKQYVRQVPQTVERFGGKYLVRGAEAFVVSGDWQPGRLIIVEFASMEKFRAWWDSPEYRLIAPLREESATTNAIVMQGVSSEK